MKSIPELTVDEAVKLGFEIKLSDGADDDCAVEVSVTAPDTLDGRQYTGMSPAFFRDDELLFLSNGLKDWHTHSFVVAAEMLSQLVILAVYSDDERGYGHQILFSNLEWACSR